MTISLILGYKEETKKFFIYDVALITLKVPFDIRAINVNPICLPYNLPYMVWDHSILTVTGK